MVRLNLNMIIIIVTNSQISLTMQAINNVNQQISKAEQTIQTCAPKCINNGICQYDTNAGKFVCICTPDYNGSYCEIELQSPLVDCDSTTCRNGGFCAGTYSNPVCNCPIHTKGKMCERRSAIYALEIDSSKFKNSENTAIVPNTLQFESILTHTDLICQLIQNSMQSGKHIWLSNSLTNCKFDSINLNMKLIIFELYIDLSEKLLNELTNSHIAEQIESGFKMLNLNELEYKVLTSYIYFYRNITSFTINLRNPCEYGYHDCSNYAKCIFISKANFDCSCNAFTIDTSPDSRFPGRRCLYDGLIIFTFTIVGLLISALSIVICGCQKTIWRKFRKQPETIDLINMPKTYEI